MPRLPLALLAVLAACGPAPPEPGLPPGGEALAPRPDRAVPAHADSLIGRVDARAFAGAFEALERLGYEATVRVETQTGAGGLGHAAYRVEQSPGRRRVVQTSASPPGGPGALAESAGAARLPPRDPLRAVLSDAPPYAEPATRERYETRLSAHGVVRARLREGTRGAAMPVEAVRARVDPATGRVLAADVRRASESLVLDEATRARVVLGAGPGGTLVPAAFSTTSRVRTALGDARTVRVSWRVQSVGGAPVRALPDADLPDEP